MGIFNNFLGKYAFNAAISYQKAAGFKPVAYHNNTYVPPQYGNGGEKWENGLTQSGQSLVINQFTMMMNARRAYHDSPQGRGIVESLVEGFVGSGLRYESAIKFEELGITQEEAQRIGAILESRFDSWARSKGSSRDGSMNFYQMQSLYCRSQVRDGEIFVRFYYSNDRKLLSPLQLSLIDPTQIQGQGIIYTGGPFNYDDGIQRNARGEETGYKISVQEESGSFRTKIVDIPAVLARSKKTSMIHGFMAEYAGQKRGYSRIGHILQELQTLQTFGLTTLDKAVGQSKIMGWQLPSKDAPSTNAFEGFQTLGVTNQSVDLAESEQQATESYRTSVCDIPEASMAPSGSVFVANLGSGEDIKFAPNSAPADKYSEFVEGYMTYLAASCGTSIEEVTKKWGNSFSAMRGTLLQTQNTKVIYRDDISSDFCDKVFLSWLSEEVAMGKISLPGFSDPRLKSAWANSRWVGSGILNIDQLKTANAAKINMALSLTTGERESKNLNGSSFDTNIAKNTQSFEIMPRPYWETDNEVEDEPEIKEDE